GYHTYGVMWDPQHITFYFDGQVTGQQDTPADMHQTMYLLADLAMQAKSGVTDDPKHLNIDYIRAYSNDPNAKAVALDHVSSPDGADTSSLNGAMAANSQSGSQAGNAGGGSAPPTSTPPTDAQNGTLTLHVSGDHYAGDPQFLVFADGHQIGGPQSVQAV